MKKFFFNSYNFLLLITGVVFITTVFLNNPQIQGIINVSALIILLIYALVLMKVYK
ncbi:MAG: hypothetical protein E6356_10830 [Terrisporobacter othiniensis]|uniref:Uncharacterized protein n=1 Tax=Terrisporobacter hibernicus TaxID=2813371 RepID=A0AAX2ZEM8_9FIRM|nr:hypothetical protein [Terrisporobacter hibernicus]MBN9645693.1 hypothetical protein [Terrisporobacter glycolicus]MDU4861688.1 hypothetical protein [Terrisporobacter othiniensis]MDU6995341.1 hypothetical protein [Terrisporobacter othiniensis]UEL47733.1 hypothetical protein JW646_19300 [Terrisporobacter hibernicus]SFJ20599.1 hypothetical protein SAMN02910355_1536 [Terrisporobacter glycolicus]